MFNSSFFIYIMQVSSFANFYDRLCIIECRTWFRF